MTYKILETRQQNEILYTTVEYNFDGTVVTIELGHSAPRDITEVEDNIKLRATTELYKIQAATQLTTIVNELQVDVEKPIN
jgi:hypothetical protein